MLKVSLIIDCDGCRRLFPYSRFASDDTTAWQVHGETLVHMAEEKGWTRTECGNFHYCLDCYEELLAMQMDSELLF